MTTPQSANDLLMSGGIKSIGWKEHQVGYTVIGTVVDEPKVVQMTKYDSTELDFWPSGDPKLEIQVILQTELRDPANPYDDGKRKLHIQPRMMNPVREACQRAGAPGLQIGGKLAVRRTGGTGATGSPFEFAAEYQQPAVDPGGLLAASQPPAAAAPATPPAAAPVQGSLMTAVAVDTPPPGIDAEKWKNLPEAQKAAVRAAMSPATETVPF